MLNSSIVPKRERSPTPPLTLTPKTSGVKLIAPLPLACKKSSPCYQRARKQWVKDEMKKLNALGLTVTRKFVRDDGLSLEWESPVPVWQDTLQPANVPSSSSSPIHVEEDVAMRGEPEPPHVDQAEELEKEATELEDLAIAFLEKFVQTFDTDRTALAGAYATNALFSYSVHEHSNIPRNSVAAAFANPNAEAHRFAPRKGARNLQQPKTSGNIHSGPSAITSALRSLGPHKFCARSPTELHFDVLALQPQLTQDTRNTNLLNSISLVFLSSHGELTDERSGSEKCLSFDQCFVLQRPQAPDSETHQSLRPGSEWPLVAVNHQLTVRDLSFRPLTI